MVIIIKEALLFAFLGTLFTFIMTTLGSATVFFFKQKNNTFLNNITMGFAAGVMLAATVWSLIIPATKRSEELKIAGFIPTSIGILLGVLFLFILEKAINRINKNSTEVLKNKFNSSHSSKFGLMILAITLHNIPEGMAVGLSFAIAQNGTAELAAAIALAIGIGIQNFPEGMAVALPLREEGISRKKAFIRGSLSGIVEPIFGVAVVLIYPVISYLMPWFLSFAAGAMLYVVVNELIPTANVNAKNKEGTFGVIAGFVLMMILDLAL